MEEGIVRIHLLSELNNSMSFIDTDLETVIHEKRPEDYFICLKSTF
jgi:hypothetical protein